MANNWGFRSIFALALVISILVFVCSYSWGRESAPLHGAKADWLGVHLLNVVVFGLTWLVSPFAGHLAAGAAAQATRQRREGGRDEVKAPPEIR